MKYCIDHRFATSVERTTRVLEIAESFGLGLSDKIFVIYDKLELEVEQGDVVYITGQSGSGKSLLLRDLTEQMAAEGKNVINLNEIVFEERPVIDLVGKTTTDAANLLAQAGISDAYLYLRTPSQLSDGQLYRLKLAKLIESGADVWVADEFGAILDRITAKVVSYNLQKMARRLGKTFMIATTHTDLTEDLNPSLTIVKRFREKIEIKRIGDEVL